MTDDKDKRDPTTSADNNLLASVIRLGIGAIGSVAGATGLLFALGFLIVNISLSSYGVYETGLLRERYISTGIAFLFILSILTIFWVYFIPSGLKRFLSGLKRFLYFLGVRKDDNSSHDQGIDKFVKLLVVFGAPIFISLVATLLVAFIWKISTDPSKWVNGIVQMVDADFRNQQWNILLSAKPVFVWCMLVSLFFIAWRSKAKWDEVKDALEWEKEETSSANEETEEVREGGKGVLSSSSASSLNSGVYVRYLRLLIGFFLVDLVSSILKLFVSTKSGENQEMSSAMEKTEEVRNEGNGRPPPAKKETQDTQVEEILDLLNVKWIQILFFIILLFLILVVYARNVFPALPAAMGGGLPIVVQFSAKDETDREEMIKLDIPFETDDGDNEDGYLITRRVTLIARTSSSYVLLVFHPELANYVIVSLPKDHVGGIIYYPEEYSLNEEYRFERLIQNGEDALTRGENQTAINIFNEALKQKPDYLPAHIGLGDAYVAESIAKGPACEGKGCIEEAVKSYNNALCPTGNIQDCENALGGIDKTPNNEVPATNESRLTEARAIDKTLIAEALYKISRAYALQEVNLGLSLSTQNNPFFVTLRDGAQKAADEAGAKLMVVDAQDDPNREATNIEDLIRQGVDAILVNPTDADEVVSSIQKANKAGIPVFTIDRSANGGVVVSHIASGNIIGGMVAGKFLCDALGGQGKVVELEGIAETSTAQDRGKGFNTYLSKVCPGIEIVARQTANFNRAEGLTVFENILQEQPEIDGTFAHNDEMILAAIEAAESAGRASETIFVGFDAVDDAVAAVKAGKLAATIAQQPAEMGRLGIETAVKYLNEEIVGQYIPVELSLTAGDIKSEETEAPPEPTEVTLGLSLSTLNNPFFVTLRNGAQAAADAAGAKLMVVDAQDDPNREATNIEDLIRQGVDAILVNPTDADEVVSSIQKANKAGIPVFTIDRSANGGVVVSHIASDNIEGGMVAGKFLCDALGGQGKVVELEGIAETSTARDRGNGFNEYMSTECPGVEIVARQTANFNRAEGLTVFENILQEQPEIDGTFAHNDEMILAAIEAAESAGRASETIFVGFDAVDDAVNAVNEGKLAATVAQQPALMGQLGVMVALRSLGGGSVEEYIPIDLSLVSGTLEPKELEVKEPEGTELERTKLVKESKFLEFHCPNFKVNNEDSIDYRLTVTHLLKCAIDFDTESENPKNYLEIARSDVAFYLRGPSLRATWEFVEFFFPSLKDALSGLSTEASSLQESEEFDAAIDRYNWAIAILTKKHKDNLIYPRVKKAGLYFNRASLYMSLYREKHAYCESVDCLREAIVDYEEAVKIDRDNATYLIGLADARRAANELDEAVSNYEKVTESVELSGYASAWLGLGETLLLQGGNLNARDAFSQAIVLQPGNAAAYYGRAVTEARIGEDLVQAIRDLRQAIALEETYLQKAEGETVIAPLIETYDFILAKQIFEAGQVDERGGNLEDAIQKYQEAIQLDPLNDAYYAALAKAYRELPTSSWEEAEQAYLQAIKLDPESDIYYLRLGEVYAAQGKYEKAISYFNTATEQSPENDIYHLRLGEVYAAQGKYDQARDAFSESIDKQPENAAAYYGRSVAEARIGEDLDQAIRDLLQAITLEETYLQKAEDEPVFAPLIDLNDLILAKQKFEAGQIDEREGNLEEAKQKYLEAIELDRLNDAYHAALANAYRISDPPSWNEAEIAYQKAIELYPESDIYHFNLGEVYAAQGKYEQAAESFNTAIELSPENDVYHFRLGELYITQGKYQRAIEPFIAAINIDREKAIYYDRLSAVYFKEGFGFVASYAGKQAVKLEPGNLDYRFHLADIYRQIGSWYLAIINYNQIIELDPEYGDAYCGLAIVYYQSGEVEEAEVAYPNCQQLGVNDNLKGQAEAEKTTFEVRQNGIGEGS